VASRIEKTNIAELKLAIDKVEENQDLIKAMVKEDGVKSLTEGEQVEYFVDLLIKAKILTESKNVVNKDDAKEMFQSYKELLPALKVSGGYEVSYNLYLFWQLEYKIFKKAAKSKIIDDLDHESQVKNNLCAETFQTSPKMSNSDNRNSEKHIF
jgi:hypothetical protein